MPQCSLHDFLCLSSLLPTMWSWSWSWCSPVLLAAWRPRPELQHCPAISLLNPCSSFLLGLPPRCQRSSPFKLPRRHAYVRRRRITRSSRTAAGNSTVHDGSLAYEIVRRRHKRSTEIEDNPAALKPRPRLSARHAKVRMWPRQCGSRRRCIHRRVANSRGTAAGIRRPNRHAPNCHFNAERASGVFEIGRARGVERA